VRRIVKATVAALGAATVALILSTIVGHATSLSISGSKSLGSSNATVAKCDTDGFTVVYTISGANFSGVTIGQIASACGGASLSATINNGTANSTGTGTVPAGGGSLAVTFAAAVPAKDSTQLDISVNGP
jgi:hypothetical protein